MGSSSAKYEHHTPWPAFKNPVHMGSSSAKYEHHTPWPAFKNPVHMDSSSAKYEHHTPWPAFKNPVHEDSLSKVMEDESQGALKVSCGKCQNPQGHEFLKDGPDKEGSRF